MATGRSASPGVLDNCPGVLRIRWDLDYDDSASERNSGGKIGFLLEYFDPTAVAKAMDAAILVLDGT
jgi:hypothetical protein